MSDELQHNLESLQRDDCYRVDAVLKAGEHERTERVFFVGTNGAELGPFVRKTFCSTDGIGTAWQRIFHAQQEGARFIHVPRIIDCYEAGEHFVVIMECIAGKTFEEIIDTCGASVETACKFFPSACDAVVELHESFTPALIHRDIKPSNLIVSNNTAVLIDLSIARTFNRTAVVDTTKFGSRGFAPPEQFGFGQTDVRSDVYGLGMLLFSLLTGNVPEPLTIEPVMREHNVSPEVCAVVLNATSFDPAARYQTVARLKQAFLLATNKKEPVLTSSPGPTNTGKQTHTNQPTATGQNHGKRIQNVSREGRLSRAGVVWDAVLAAASALLFAVCALIHLFPTNEFASMNPLARGFQLLGVWALFTAPALVLCDPRPLALYLPRFSNLSFSKRLVIAVVVALVSCVIIGVAHSVS